SGFPGLKIVSCDGTDFLASYAAMAEAVAHCRKERAPVLVHATVIRPYSHSLSDDEKLYKTKEERSAEAGRDPLVKFPQWLLREGILDQPSHELITHEIELETQQATERVLKAAPPAKGSALRYLYSERVDPTSAEFDAEPQFSGEPRTMVDSINAT